MSSSNIIELTDRWILQTQNLIVTQLAIDYAIRIELWVSDEHFFSILIEADFQFINQNNEEITVKPRTLEGICSVLMILHVRVNYAIIKKSGSLELIFTNGCQILVKPDYEFEPWNITGPGGLLFVCKPSGEVSIWNYE